MNKSRSRPRAGLALSVPTALVFSSVLVSACGSSRDEASSVSEADASVSLGEYTASLLASDRIDDRGREQLERIARAHGMNRQTLEKLAKEDKNLKIDREDNLFYACPSLRDITAENPEGGFDLHEDAASDAGDAHGFALQSTGTDAFRLHSRPQAARKILLDFDGHVTTGTSWNSSRNMPSIVTPAYDKDGVPTSFSAAELADIKAIWQAVAEDYAAFDVDVTTEDPGNSALSGKGIRISIGGNGLWFGAAGGVAFINSFGLANTPAFVFSKNLGPDFPKYVWEAVSHEAGHTLGLYHDGTVATATAAGQGYYTGQGNWAPIMGVGYYKPITQFDRGEYANANNKQDDVAILASRLGFIPDDYASTLGSALALTGSSLNLSGLISQRSDLDFFKLNLGTGNVSLSANGVAAWNNYQRSNVTLRLSLLDASGRILASSNLSSNAVLSTSISQPGTYFLSVDGVGQGTPSTTGYSDYGSLGAYQLSGSVPAR